ncbi:MAG: hypothetical protein VX498_09435, partial [Myxococcota bacterium]|nr:hypothetical protein [Myxococcota bacterium]
VTFTALEAEATLNLANDASYEELDLDLGLDRRAADSIVAAQPILTIDELAGLYFVGTTALQALLDAAGTPTDVSNDQFVADVADFLVDYYDGLEDDIVDLGGSCLEEAQEALDPGLVTELNDSDEDPYSHDFESVRVLSHPDVIFPGSDAVLFAAYHRASGTLVEVYSFE